MPGHGLLVRKWTTSEETTSLGMSWLRFVGTTLLLNLCRLLSRLVTVLHDQWVEKRSQQIWRWRMFKEKINEKIFFCGRLAGAGERARVGGGEGGGSIDAGVSVQYNTPSPP